MYRVELSRVSEPVVESARIGSVHRIKRVSVSNMHRGRSDGTARTLIAAQRKHRAAAQRATEAGMDISRRRKSVLQITDYTWLIRDILRRLVLVRSGSVERLLQFRSLRRKKNRGSRCRFRGSGSNDRSARAENPGNGERRTSKTNRIETGRDERTRTKNAELEKHDCWIRP